MRREVVLWMLIVSFGTLPMIAGVGGGLEV